MEDAIKDVSSGEYTLSESAILHGVPRKTLTKLTTNTPIQMEDQHS